MSSLDKLTCLVRYNALSRTIESALQKDSIPNKIVGGHKFFERLEVKDLLAYLQLTENPGFNVRPLPDALADGSPPSYVP
jgi:DNA helicase-2/ATP-dependent DNA helicase PcrA